MLKIKLITLFLSLFSLTLSAQIPDGYYSSAEGLTGEELKTELHNIIDDHHSQSYDDLWTDFQDTDAKPDGTVWDMYSDIPDGDPPYVYNFGTDQCGNYSGEGSCYNREHSFPKSWFDDASPMNTDLYHLYPTDGSVNGQRGNYPYGETDSPSWTSENGSKKGPCSYSGYNGTVFEPIDEYKGDFARTYFYMVTRYESQVAGWSSNMLDGTSYPAFEEWAINMLMEWHQNDPVSDKEINRNNAVYNIQNNRNPFIDHPEYVNEIWGNPDQNTKPYIANIETVPSTPGPTDAVNVKASITDQTGEIASAKTDWGYSSNTLDNTLSMSDQGSFYQTNTKIPKHDKGTTIYFQVSATDDSSSTSKSDIKSYTVRTIPDTILSEDFSSCPPENWIVKDLSGSENWSCTNDYMEINAYNSDAACDDWLISPGLNLQDYTNDSLSFKTWTKYSDTYYPPLEVKYSTDYTSGDAPSTATWGDLTCNLSPENSETWTLSGKIDLTQINSTNVHIAFHYTSSGTGAGTSSLWKLDDVILTGQTTEEYQAPLIDTVMFSPKTPESGEGVAVFASVESQSPIQKVNLLWGKDSNTYPNQLSLKPLGGYYTDSIPGQTNTDTVFFMIEATNYSDTTAKSDEYIVIYKKNGTYIQNDNQNISLKIYPNPSKSHFYIDFRRPTIISEVNLYSLSGKLVHKAKYSKTMTRKRSFKTTGVPRGTYLIEIKTKKHSVYKKVIIQ